jgi:hypothetical protein
MALTSTQISDLNGSNVAMQNASVGTFINNTSASVTTLNARKAVASGSIVPTDGEREVVETGLSSVDHVAVSLSGSPSGDHLWSTATAGSVAGVVIIQSWTATDVDDVTPKSASAAWSKVEWVASGTA